jgi:hypothetical protein
MKQPRDKKLLLWAIGGFFWINIGGSMLHFAFELSEYYRPLALIAAVNESVWEHLKMYFWSGLLLALVQYTYVRDVARNYWFGQAVGLLVTPFVIILSFYFYLGIAFPMYGRGWLAADIGTGALGVIAGQYVSYRMLTREPLSIGIRRNGAAVLYSLLIVAFLSFTYYPPRIFLFENFFGYTYRGDYGILKDYEPYRIFRPADYSAREPESGDEP